MSDAFFQSASQMTKAAIAEYIWNSSAEDRFIAVLLEAFWRKCTTPIEIKMYLIVSDLMQEINDNDDKVSAYEILLDHTNDDTMIDIYGMIGTIEGDAAEANAIDDAIDRSKGL